MTTTERVLCRSEHYIIHHEYEEATLTSTINESQLAIGDFYGNPSCAYISPDEKYCIVGGCGFIIYWLEEPFLPYQYDKKTKQWQEYFRHPDDTLWIEAIYEGDFEDEIRMVVDPLDKIKGGIYSFNMKTREMVRILPER